MDVHNTVGGSLKISTDVVAKIARYAALEIDGVAAVSGGDAQSMRGLLGKASIGKPVEVALDDGVAAIAIDIVVIYGCKVMAVSEKVQENVKQAVQNMTGIAVSKVDVIVTGLVDAAPQEQLRLI